MDSDDDERIVIPSYPRLVDHIIENITGNKPMVLETTLWELRRFSKKQCTNICEILKLRADSGNSGAIECIYRINKYINDIKKIANVDDRTVEIIESIEKSLEYFKNIDITKYIWKLPKDKLNKILKHDYNLMVDYIFQILTPMKEQLEQKIVELKNEIKYMPNGDGYRDAKREFDSIANK